MKLNEKWQKIYKAIKHGYKKSGLTPSNRGFGGLSMGRCCPVTAAVLYSKKPSTDGNVATFCRDFNISSEEVWEFISIIDQTKEINKRKISHRFAQFIREQLWGTK